MRAFGIASSAWLFVSGTCAEGGDTAAYIPHIFAIIAVGSGCSVLFAQFLSRWPAIGLAAAIGAIEFLLMATVDKMDVPLLLLVPIGAILNVVVIASFRSLRPSQSDSRQLRFRRFLLPGVDSFSLADQRRRRSLPSTSGSSLLRLVIDTAPCLSPRISEKSCPENQGAISNSPPMLPARPRGSGLRIGATCSQRPGFADPVPRHGSIPVASPPQGLLPAPVIAVVGQLSWSSKNLPMHHVTW
jgi:hypothetical protein